MRELDDEEHGIGLPPGIVPQITYVLVRDGSSIGEIRFRPQAAEGRDHIGYNVRPLRPKQFHPTLRRGQWREAVLPVQPVGHMANRADRRPAATGDRRRRAIPDPDPRSPIPDPQDKSWGPRNKAS